MSGSASATPSSGSSQTSSSESPTDLDEVGRKVYRERSRAGRCPKSKMLG